jgi:hypothetical protein
MKNGNFGVDKLDVGITDTGQKVHCNASIPKSRELMKYAWKLKSILISLKVGSPCVRIWMFTLVSPLEANSPLSLYPPLDYLPARCTS